MLRPVFQRAAKSFPVEDPWEELSLSVPLERYADGLEDDFTVYLRGPSNVSVTSIEDIKQWLLGCSYMTDREQFGREFWQHLLEFESRRVGDCDDYAIWTWRKLIELGVEARLVTGRCLPLREGEAGHVWVVYPNKGKLFRLRWNGVRGKHDPAIRGSPQRIPTGVRS